MDATRKATLAAGLFYIGTFVFSIPALGLYEGVLDDPNFVLGAGSDQGVLWGGLIEILTALTGIGTAVALYPVIKRHGPGRAIGFVASRTLEAAMIFTGVLAVLSVYTLRQDFAGGDRHDLADDHGQRPRGSQGLDVPARPRRDAGHQRPLLRHDHVPVPAGAPLDPDPRPDRRPAPAHLLDRQRCSAAGSRFPPPRLLMALPIAAWEFSVGVYMIVKGFRTPATDRADATIVPAEPADLAHA